MITQLLEKEGHVLTNISCGSWEELVDILAATLLSGGVVEPQFVESAKEAVRQFGGYVVLVEDIAFFHGRPDAGVHELALTFALLKEPIFLSEKRIKVAFLLAATDNVGHRNLLKELSMFLNDESCLELLRKGENINAIMGKFKEIEEQI
ncbi:MAG: PTS sugar transporter subunit IIA [Oscillospiraceae bacterium]|nr:PTS sugar transporter subunit IIA [Oscillospiraceae bacterium]MCL2279739.1 PTS sugar transporter subunit IIA [Oscillospiraceae bacterium]